jgi:flagellar basal body-associated protein FliL
MPKLDALKEKAALFRQSLSEKVDKIAFLRKWKESKAAPAAASPYSLGQIYRQGGTATRLQVVFVYVLAIAAIASTLHAGRRIFSQLGTSAEHEKLKQEYAKGFAEISQRVTDKASIVSLGKFTTSAYSEPGRKRMMGVDVWLRVSDPDTAEFVQKNEAILHDRLLDSLNQVYLEKIDILTEKGKVAAKSRIQENLNKALPKGSVEDIFFHNLVMR